MTMPKLKKDEDCRSTYEKYQNEDINYIYDIVKAWLFEYRKTRDMDEDILGIKNDNYEHGGWESWGILHFIGLNREWRTYFKNNNITIEEAIFELKNTEDPDYLELINILENILEIEEKNEGNTSEEEIDVQIVSSDEENDLSFNDAFKIVSAILLEKNGIEIKADDYDGLLARKLSDTDPITENRSPDKDGEPTHIAITGQQRNMFPYLMAYGYFTEIEYNTDFKSYFVFKAPVFLNNSNLNYLYDNIENERLNEQYITTGRNPFESIDTYLENLDEQMEYYKSKGQKFETSVSVLRSRKLPRARGYASEDERKCDRRQDQIELSQKNTDGKAFLLLRKLLFSGDYLIILKQKTEPKYDMYGIKNEDAGELSKLLKKYFYNYVSNNKSTSVPPHMFEDCYASTELIFETDLDQNITRNKIYFGAPGTGKSYELNKSKDKLLKNYENKEELYERVTFHPDYSYANFVGTYKPISEKNKTDNDKSKSNISYEYVPGPFMRLLVKALENAREDSPKPFLLIIEEINRANVSAVFGEVFQLLDRNKNGASEYAISTSKEMQDFFVKELKGRPEDYSKIKIPNNMVIWATMNSADQGVYPVDTAFKRRWDFEYIDLNHDENKNEGYILAGGNSYRWNKVRQAINDFLIDEGINEDKCMGAFFIKDENNNDYTEMFRKKVLMYLFEDLRSKRKELFAYNTRLSYSKILKDFDDVEIGLKIFNGNIWKQIPKETSHNNEEINVEK